MNDKFLSVPIGPNRFFLPSFPPTFGSALKALSKLEEKKDLAETE